MITNTGFGDVGIRRVRLKSKYHSAATLWAVKGTISGLLETTVLTATSAQQASLQRRPQHGTLVVMSKSSNSDRRQAVCCGRGRNYRRRA